MEFISWLICLIIATVVTCVVYEYIEVYYAIEVPNMVKTVSAVVLLRIMRIRGE